MQALLYKMKPEDVKAVCAKVNPSLHNLVSKCARGLRRLWDALDNYIDDLNQLDDLGRPGVEPSTGLSSALLEVSAAMSKAYGRSPLFYPEDLLESLMQAIKGITSSGSFVVEWEWNPKNISDVLQETFGDDLDGEERQTKIALDDAIPRNWIGSHAGQTFAEDRDQKSVCR